MHASTVCMLQWHCAERDNMGWHNRRCNLNPPEMAPSLQKIDRMFDLFNYLRITSQLITSPRYVGSGLVLGSAVPPPFPRLTCARERATRGSCSDHRGVPHAYDAQLTFQVTSVQRRPAATQELLDTVYRIGFPPRLSLHLPHTRPLSPTKGPSLRIQFPSTQASIR